jgi:hypothetical protein
VSQDVYEEDPDYVPKDRDTGSCAVCGEDIVYLGGVYGECWAHTAPAKNTDNHQAELGGPR